MSSDYRDADGFVDCWSYCSTFQDAVAGTLFFGPLAAIVFLVIAVALLAVRGLRRRKPRSRAARSS